MANLFKAIGELVVDQNKKLETRNQINQVLQQQSIDLANPQIFQNPQTKHLENIDKTTTEIKTDTTNQVHLLNKQIEVLENQLEVAQNSSKSSTRLSVISIFIALISLVIAGIALAFQFELF